MLKGLPFICPRCTGTEAERTQSSSQETILTSQRPLQDKTNPRSDQVRNNEPSGFKGLDKSDLESVLNFFNDSKDEVPIEPDREEEPAGSSQLTTNSSSQTSETVSNGDTDDEGYATVKRVVNHRGTGRNREFLIEYVKNNEQLWIKEKDCDGCVLFIEKYCILERIPEPTVKYKKGCGAAATGSHNVKNWASIDEILQKAIKYGNPEHIQPQIFTCLEKKDGLYIIQVGNHCLSFVHLYNRRAAIIADGENVYRKDPIVRSVMLLKLAGVRSISHLPFYSQKEDDHCASSGAAIAIEMQRRYSAKIQDWLSPIRPAASTIDRIRKSLHKEPGSLIRKWLPIQGGVGWRVKCSGCGTMMNTKNRGSLNLHKCPSF